jgi:hypothetical protein
MNHDVNPFPVDMTNSKEKKILVRTSQATTTKWKNIIVSNEPRARMIKPQQPEVGVWKANEHKKKQPEWSPTSSFLAEKYLWEQEQDCFSRNKRRRSLGYRGSKRTRADYQFKGRYEETIRHHESQVHQDQFWS